jgi:hypothetical protein
MMELDGRGEVRIDRRFLGWGVFFVVLGAVPLAVRQGLVTEDQIRQAWGLWPLILIGIGVGLVLRRTPFEALGGLIVAGTFGLILGSAIATGDWNFGGFGSCGGSEDGKAFEARSGTLAGEAAVSIAVDCGDLAVAPAAGSAWRIEGTNEDGDGPRIEDRGSALDIRSREGGGFFGGSRDSWRVTLPTDPTIRLDLTVNAANADVDLSAMRVPDLHVTANAADVTIDMAAATAAATLTAKVNAGTVRITLPVEDLRGSVSANAGSIELCAPANVGLRFQVDENITATYDFGRGGLVQVGDAWESPGYASAEVRIELQADANAGSIVLDPEGGCDG